MNRPFVQKKNEKRINDAIIAREIVVIDETGENLWKMSRDSALNLAGEKDLDLVEVWLQDGIVLAKIVDYGKQLFKQQKQQSQNKGNTKKQSSRQQNLPIK